MLSWGLKRGHVVIPKSTIKEEYESNFQSHDFALTEKDMMRLSDLESGQRCYDYIMHVEHGNIPIFH